MTPEDRLVTEISGNDCQFCETGELAAGEYKGNRAAVCDECGTPQIQSWDTNE